MLVSKVFGFVLDIVIQIDFKSSKAWLNNKFVWAGNTARSQNSPTRCQHFPRSNRIYPWDDPWLQVFQTTQWAFIFELKDSFEMGKKLFEQSDKRAMKRRGHVLGGTCSCSSWQFLTRKYRFTVPWFYIVQQNVYTKTLDTIGNCQIPVFSLTVSQQMLEISNLRKFELIWSSKFWDNNERKKHPCHTKLCALRCLISRPQILNLRSRNQICGKLRLSRKLRHFRGSRFSQCVMLPTSPHYS